MRESHHGVTIRRARPDEVVALNALIMRSKLHWGYAVDVGEAYRLALSLGADTIERNHVVCAEVDGRLAGVAQVIARADGDAELEHLFVEPAFIGQGVGRRLWQRAVELARSLEATALVFDSDPHARAFYERQGAVVVGEHESTVIVGVRIPRLRYGV